MSAGGPWYRRWFGRTYLALYPHRDEAEAERAVRLLRQVARPEPGDVVLDLGCGAGRHLAALRAAGLAAVGVDLSEALLSEARARGVGGPLIQGDMRQLPFRERAFGAVASFFTSFGYFASAREDEEAAREVARVLRPGGVFLLDYLNAPRVRATLVPEDEAVVEGCRVRQRRWLDGGTVVKRIEVLPEGEEQGAPEVHFERVRLYEPEELERMLGRCGLRATSRYGDYDGSPYRRASPRLILVGRRTEATRHPPAGGSP